MPLPTPNAGESRNDFVSRCISFETKASPERPADQIQAMCFTQWRKAKGEKLSEEDFNTMERYALFADNSGYESQYTKKKGIKLWRKQVLKFGTWVHPDNPDITFDITPFVVKQIISNFNSGIPEEAPVTLTHSDNPKDKVGRVRSFEVADDGLYAILAVADESVNDKIALSKETAPGVSCWLDLNHTDKQTGDELGAVVKHVALVNHPYIEGMTGFTAVLSMFKDDADYLPLVMSEKEKQHKDFSAMTNELSKEQLVKILKEKHDVDVAALLSSAEELTTLHDRIDKGELVDKGSVSLGEDLEKRIRETLQLSEDDKLELTALIKKLLDKVGNLSSVETRLADTERKLTDMEAEKEVGALLSAGRIFPAEKDAFLTMFKKTPDAFKEIKAAREKMEKPLIQLGEKGVATDETKDQETAEEVLKRQLDAAENEGRIKK